MFFMSFRCKFTEVGLMLTTLYALKTHVFYSPSSHFSSTIESLFTLMHKTKGR